MKWKRRWKETRRWKKIGLILLAAFLLFQIPFIYRRIRLGSLSSAIREVNTRRVVNADANAFVDYKGVIHVHSSLGGHSYGSFPDIIHAANRNGLSFVVMTEHTSTLMDTSAMTLNGVHSGVLFINGNEINTASHDRMLLIPGGAEAAGANLIGTEEALVRQKTQGGLAFVAYPEEFHSWNSDTYDGIEVYNLFTNTKKINSFVMLFDSLWSYWSYPDLMFVRFYQRPTEELSRWDELMRTKGRKLVAIAGNDAHANVGFRLGDLTGKEVVGLQVDPYERAFSIVRNHVLIEREKPLDRETLSAALANGHSYIAFDILGDSSGFTFTATNGQSSKIMGDDIELLNGVRLTVNTPVDARVLLFRDGEVIRDEDGTSRKEYDIADRGAYRVEVYLTQLGSLVDDKPWIISNPIYVR